MDTSRTPGRSTYLQAPGRIFIALSIVAVAAFIVVGIVTKDPAIPFIGTICTASLAAVPAHRARQVAETANEADAEDPLLPPTPSAQQLDAAQARALLMQAERLGDSTRSRASAAPSLFLLSLGCLCSMLIVALHLVALTDESLVWLPLAVSMPWLTILLIAFGAFHRSAKAGFSTRWLQVMTAWGVLWLLIMLGMTILWRGELWFALTGIGAITAVTTWGAWREARK